MPTSRTSTGFWASVAALAAGTGLSQLAAVLSTPVLTRLFTPEDFGHLAVYLALVGFLGPVSSLRYTVAIPVARTMREFADLIVLSALLVGAVGITVVATASLLAGPRFAGLMGGEGSLGMVGAAVFAGVVLTGLTDLGAHVWIRDGRMTPVARSTASQGLVATGAKVGAGVVGLGSGGLIGGTIAGWLVGLIVIAAPLRRTWARALRRSRVSSLARTAGSFRQFPLYQGSSQLLLGLGAQLPAVAVALVFGSATAGQFGVAMTVVGLPTALVGKALNQANFSRFSGRSGRIDNLGPENDELIWRVLAGGIPFALVTGVGSWYLFAPIFGDEWVTAGRMAALLMPYLVSRIVALPLASVLVLVDRQELLALLNGARVVMAASCFFAAWLLDLTPMRTVGIFSLTLTAYHVVLVAVCRREAYAASPATEDRAMDGSPR